MSTVFSSLCLSQGKRKVSMEDPQKDAGEQGKETVDTVDTVDAGNAGRPRSRGRRLNCGCLTRWKPSNADGCREASNFPCPSINHQKHDGCGCCRDCPSGLDSGPPASQARGTRGQSQRAVRLSLALFQTTVAAFRHRDHWRPAALIEPGGHWLCLILIGLARIRASGVHRVS